nr:hypothetical protein [Lysinibacillus timonensis]
MLLTIGDKQFDFYKAELIQMDSGLFNTFSKFVKKTLGELIAHHRYDSIKEHCVQKYSHLLDLPAGPAILQLKNEGDTYYKKFLNNYGDLNYSHFQIKGNETILNKSGVYTIIVDQELVFTGVCANSFKVRFNQHIGNISPKSCFKDGTATHCHVNANITEKFNTSKVQIQLCPLTSKSDMKSVRNYIINRFEPIWNIRLAKEERQSIIMK